jgi:hypothetical protein
VATRSQLAQGPKGHPVPRAHDDVRRWSGDGVVVRREPAQDVTGLAVELTDRALELENTTRSE